MKRLVATLSLTALATGAFAQGFVSIANNGGATAIYTVSFGVSNLTSKTAGAFYYDVLVNSSTVTTINASLQGLVAAGWSDSGLTGVNNTGVGPGGKITAVNTLANNWAAGTELSAIVIGWSGTLGTTWSAVAAAIAGDHFTPGLGWSGLANGYVGYSTIAQAIAGPDAGTAALLFTTANAATPNPITTGFGLYGIPEPGALAVAGLGVASLSIFRRRK